MITIVIPTRNRSHFVEVYIKQMQRWGFCGELIFLDGGDEPLHKFIRYSPDELPFVVKICRVPRGPDEEAWENIARGIERAHSLIETPYVCLAFDDDWVSPAFVNLAVTALESDLDVGFVLGQQAHVRLQSKSRKSSLGRSKILYLWSIRAYVIARNIYQRKTILSVKEFFNIRAQILYGITRRKTFINFTPRDYRRFTFAVLANDFSWYISLLGSGRALVLKQLQVVRVFHGDNMHSYKISLPKLMTKLTDGSLSWDYNSYKEKITQHFYDDPSICCDATCKKVDHKKLEEVVSYIICCGIGIQLNVNTKSLNSLYSHLVSRFSIIFIFSISELFLIFSVARAYQLSLTSQKDSVDR